LLAEAEQLSTCASAFSVFTTLAVRSCSSFAARLNAEATAAVMGLCTVFLARHKTTSTEALQRCWGVKVLALTSIHDTATAAGGMHRSEYAAAVRLA